MLQDLGDKLKGVSSSGGRSHTRWLGYGILGAICVVFILWGPYAAVDLSFSQGNYAAKVGKEEISATEINQTWQQRLPQILQATGGQMTDAQRDEMQQRLLDGAIVALAAEQHARKLGFRVSEAQLTEALQREQAFQVDGKFSAQAAKARLLQVGLTTEQYLEDLRNSLLSGQVEGSIGTTDFLTPAESKRLLALLDEEREVRFALLQPDDYAGTAPVDAAAIDAYYKANASQFTVPEAVKLDYAELALQDVAAGLTVTDAQLRERYERDKGRYMQGETRRARHILISIDDTTDDAKAAAQAKQIHDRIKAGADFAAQAKQFSKDSVSAAEGGDLGWSSREVFDQAFADKLFAMKEGEVSEPVKTQFGYHVIRLEGIRAGAGKSFEEVRGELEAALRTELAGTEFSQREDQLQERLDQGGATMDALVRDFGLRRGTVEHFERGAGGLPLGSDAELNRMVFSDASIAQRRIGGPAPLGEDRITIFQVREHRPGSVKPLAEVRDAIIAALKRERGSAAALAAAEAAAAKLKAGGSFDQAIAGLKASAEQPRFVGRTAPDVPVQLRDAAFAGPRPTKGQPQVQAMKLEDGSAALLAVTDSRVQAFTDNPQIQQLRTQRELRRYSLRDIDAYTDAVVAATKVRKNPQAFQQ